jgi:transcriptional antiterminator NusG
MIIDNPSASVGPDGIPVQSGQTPSTPAAEGANVPTEPAPPAPATEPASPVASEPAPASAADDNKKWYVVKVQSGREESIKDAIERRVKIEGLQEAFGQILIPTEKYTEVNRNNKRVTKERKLFPGYIMVHLEFNDRMLYLFRETSGVGDFVGGGLNKPPQPMTQKEVDRMLIKQGQIEAPVESKSKFDKGDKVKVKDGTFAGMEGEVKEVMEAKGALRVALTIFGREVPVELEYWQVDYA